MLLGGVIDYGEINRNLFWIRPNYVDTVYSTSDWTDVRPYYIIQRNNRAADYAWSVRMKVGDITREDAEREQLCNVYALNQVYYSIIYSTPNNKEQVSVRQTVKAKLFPDYLKTT